jgi:hypothetical protein
MRQRFVLILALVLSLSAVARAQAVHWEPSDSGAQELVLVFENCSPDGQPQLPVIDGVQFALAGQSTSTNFVNFSRTDSVLLTYRLRARSSAPIAIPAFDVKTDKGSAHVPGFTTGAVRSPALDGAASSRLSPASASLWAGEVFPLTYTLDVVRRNFNQLASNPEWNSAPLVVEEWSKPDGAEVVVSGEPRVNIVYKTRAYPKSAGAIAVNSATQIVNLQTGSIGFGLFQTPRVEQVSVESNRPQLTVRALPAGPVGFSGAVGQFTLVSKIVPESAAVGEPVTWTLELSGTGNWPDIAGLPSREVSNDFQVVQPRAKRTPAEGKLFDITLAEDVVLVPTKPGSYPLGPVNFIYFDPKIGAYKTLSAPRTTVTITAPNVPKPANPAPSASDTAAPAPEATEKSPAPPATPPPPAGIPRDPLPGAAQADVPLSNDTLLLCLLSPFAGLLVFWAWLALRRAQCTDPVRPRREARARLADTLAQLRTAAEGGRPALLLSWQHDTSALWQISHAAPPAAALSDSAWSALWAESERALYGPQTGLPSDWIARAEAALAAKLVPGFQPLRLFLARNLLPFAALGAILLLPGLLRAGDGGAAYRRADFTAAEKAWRDSLAKTPTDWIAHHNLSLALAQQDRAGEAAAQAAAAFVQHPADASVRWHLALACEKAGFAPAPLAAFLQPGPQQSLARLASPAGWQRVLIASAIVGALALGWILINAYGARSQFSSACASVVLGLCVLSGAIAVCGVVTYGIAADERAVIAWRAGTLRSIPTEADISQKTTPLAAGSVALADPKTYLGWTRLIFDNGQTGWVRREELVALWR